MYVVLDPSSQLIPSHLKNLIEIIALLILVKSLIEHKIDNQTTYLLNKKWMLRI